MGEAYMNGRMIFDDGDILDFGRLLRANNRFEDTGGKLSSSLSSRFFSKARFEIQQLNNRIRAKAGLSP